MSNKIRFNHHCFKKISFIIGVIMVLLTFSCPDWSSKTYGQEQVDLSNGWISYETLEDGSVRIVEGSVSDGSLVIPETLNEKPVTAIGDNAFANSELSSVLLPAGLVEIGNNAFAGCNSLSTILLPDSVTTIGDYAFSGCISLRAFGIPDSVSYIGANPFRNCENLEFFTISQDHPYFEYKEGCLISKKDGNLVMADIFEPMNITLPDSVKSIGSSAFSDCYMNSLTIPDTVTRIDDEAFAGISTMKITISDSVVKVGRNLFGDGWAQTGRNIISMPIVKELAISSEQPALKNEEGGIIRREDERLIRYCSDGAEEYIIPQGVTAIENCAFIDVRGLKRVIIPDSVTEIGENAFLNCNDMLSVVIPESVTSIADYAFSNLINKNLTFITSPGSYAEQYALDHDIQCETFATNIVSSDVELSSDHQNVADAYLRLLPDDNIAFCDVTGDGIEEMMTADGAGIHVFSVNRDPGGETYTPYELLYAPFRGTHAGDYSVRYTEDGFLLINPGGSFGFNFCDEYHYESEEMKLTTAGKQEMASNPFLPDIQWAYYMNEQPVDEAAYMAKFVDRSAKILLDDDRSVSAAMNQEVARQYLESGMNRGTPFAPVKPETQPAQTVQTEQIVSEETTQSTQPLITEERIELFLQRMAGIEGLFIGQSGPLWDKEYAGGYDPSRVIDQKWLLNQLCNPYHLTHREDFLPSFVTLDVGNVLSAEPYVKDDDSLRWVAENVFHVDSGVYEEFIEQISDGPMFQYFPVNYNNENKLFTAEEDPWTIDPIVDYVKMQQTGNIIEAEFNYRINKYESLFDWNPHAHVILEMKEENGQQYLSLQKWEKTIEDKGFIAQIERMLILAGYNCGEIDGQADDSLMAFVHAYQRDRGMAETKRLYTGVYNALYAEVYNGEKPNPDAVIESQTQAEITEMPEEDIW